VARRIAFTTCSAGSFTGPISVPSSLRSFNGYDGPEIATQPIWLIGPDAGQRYPFLDLLRRYAGSLQEFINGCQSQDALLPLKGPTLTLY
jgi:hypothetical protein